MEYATDNRCLKTSKFALVDINSFAKVVMKNILLNVRYICYNAHMMIIDELENRAVTETELRLLLEKYEALYIEEPDKAKSEEYYELDLYLQARLAAMEDVKENDSEVVKLLKAKIKELEDENRVLHKMVKNNNEGILGKKDIMLRYGKASDWALKFLHFCYNNRKASKIGRQYYVKESDISKLFEDYKGLELKLSRGKAAF